MKVTNMAKQAIKVAVILSILFTTGCNEFDRSYNKVDGEFARLLSMQFLEPDLAPGDTATIRSYWTGKPVNPATITWGVSWKFYENKYGVKVTLDSVSLARWIVEPLHEIAKIDSMQVFEMKIVIPDSIMRNSPGIENNWIGSLSKIGSSLDGEGLKMDLPSDKQGMLTLLETVANSSAAEKSTLFPTKADGELLEGICQFLSVGFVIHCDYTAAGGFQGKLFHSVRYQSKFASIPGVHVNSRPLQKGAKLHVVAQKDLAYFDPSVSPAEKVIPLTDVQVGAFSVGKAEIAYDNSKSYFLEIPVDTRDSSLSMDKIFNETSTSSSFESFSSQWFHEKIGHKTLGFTQQNDAKDEQSGTNRTVFKLVFGKDEDIVRGVPLTSYLEISDKKMASGYRPRGADLKMYQFTIR